MNARINTNAWASMPASPARRHAGFLLVAIVATLVAILSLAPRALAQAASGAIYGKVASGTVVTVQSVDTGAVRSVKAEADGSYRIGSLPAGSYKVSYTDAAGAAQTAETDVVNGVNTQIGIGENVLKLDRFVVHGMSVNPIDFASVESVTVFTEKQIDLLPVARDNTSVALLAPGTTLGDSAFGNLASFGGSSVAENAYFVNGLNISNFRNGLGAATVPFEFIKDFEVKTGGYSAEFGRSTGGVVSNTTHSGSNNYKAGANVYFEPDAGRSKAPDVYYPGTTDPYIYNGEDYSQNFTSNIYASGPLWKNKLFFYGLYQIRDNEARGVGSSGTRYAVSKTDAPFWGAKLDFLPFQNHHLEFTGFSDKQTITTTNTDYDFASKTNLGTNSSQNFDKSGGKTWIGRYTTTLFEKLTLSALWGKSTQDRTAVSSEDLKPAVYDGRSGSLVYVQGNPDILYDDLALDERVAKRLDAEYSFDLFGTHRLRAGLDREDNLSKSISQYSGGVYYRYYAIPGSGRINGVVVPTPNVGAVRVRKYSNGGNFKVKSHAWYVEDNWSLLNDRLNLRLGLRDESFQNLNANNESFIEVKDQLAPRLAASYDLRGDKRTKLLLNFGRYHLPVASNTNVRLAGGENFTQEWYALSAVTNNIPTLGAQLGSTTVFSNGTVPDTRTIVDLDIKPMYQDEWIAAIQHSLTKDLTVKLAFTQRNINGTAMDDMIVDHALNAWAHANGFPAFDATGSNHYVLANPGRPIVTYYDFNEDGDISANERATLTPQMLGYPAAVRKYYALELAVEKIWNGKWNAQFSYTWAQSYGNYEGWVLSDNGQDDAGITILFDTPDLTRNSSGFLANDRRHQFKLFGSYALTSELTLGANVLVSSGRPKNRFGMYDDAVVGSAYGPDYFTAPRGSAGRMPWQFNTNLSLRYRPKWAKDRLNVGVDVFNVLNRQAVTETVETAENSSGGAEPTYGLPYAWQRPRYVRLSVGFDY